MSELRAIAVFGSSQTVPGSSDWAQAEDVGRRLALAGLAVATGGYAGTMEAVSKGAAESGGHVIGVTAPSLFPGRTGANPYVEELIEATDLSDRIGGLIGRASGTIALPGSIGTAAELIVAWNTNHIARRNGLEQKPATAIGAEWAVIGESLVSEVGAGPHDLHFAPDVDDGLAWLASQFEIPEI